MCPQQVKLQVKIPQRQLEPLHALTDGAEEFNRTEAIRDFAALLATSEVALTLSFDLRGIST
jgi:hypothetical protein